MGPIQKIGTVVFVAFLFGGAFAAAHYRLSPALASTLPFVKIQGEPVPLQSEADRLAVDIPTIQRLPAYSVRMPVFRSEPVASQSSSMPVQKPVAVQLAVHTPSPNMQPPTPDPLPSSSASSQPPVAFATEDASSSAAKSSRDVSSASSSPASQSSSSAHDAASSSARESERPIKNLRDVRRINADDHAKKKRAGQLLRPLLDRGAAKAD